MLRLSHNHARKVNGFLRLSSVYFVVYKRMSLFKEYDSNFMIIKEKIIENLEGQRIFRDNIRSTRFSHRPNTTPDTSFTTVHSVQAKAKRV